MLFSNDAVVQAINSGFEPYWESVRPVPMVKIDFGNGHVITRTLNGNIATYACTADGQVLDILPGIYAPAEYQDRLGQLRLLANFADQEGPAKRGERLRQYHQGQLVALAKNEPPPRFINFNMADFGKAKIERRVKAVLLAGADAEKIVGVNPPKDDKAPAGDLAGWKALLEDTQHNEAVRRKEIHGFLAQQNATQPKQMTKWLYREVLHADLDDPYLGLGKVLFDNYPFAKEEGK